MFDRVISYNAIKPLSNVLDFREGLTSVLSSANVGHRDHCRFVSLAVSFSMRQA